VAVEIERKMDTPPPFTIVPMSQGSRALLAGLAPALSRIRLIDSSKSPTRRHLSFPGQPCLTGTFGLVRDFARPSGPVQSALSRRYPEVEAQLVAVMDRGHGFTNITVNRDLVCVPHKDRRNTGTTFLTAVGDFEGGELVVVDDQGREHEADPRGQWIHFDGSRHTHFVRPFTGHRMSLICQRPRRRPRG
jgi:hypothetical protein